MSTDTTLTVKAAALKRVSIRKYLPEPIPQSDIDEILEIAGKAPSAWNIQPWKVAVVHSEEMKQKLMGAAYGQPQVGAAAAVFVVYNDMEEALGRLDESVHPGMRDRLEEAKAGIMKVFGPMSVEDRAQWGHGQTNIFLGWLLLAIEATGYVSSPMLGFDAGQVKELLGLPAHVTLPGIVAVGKADGEGFSQHRFDHRSFTSYF